MGFLDKLSNSLLQTAGLAENTPGNLDSKGIPYGKLGDFAGKIDQTAHRQYLGSGIIGGTPGPMGSVRNIRSRASEILMQEPDVTVVVKKRIFSSLAENYRIDLMDDQEKMFLRATKRLFYNKCRLISAYERLTKFEKIVSKNEGIISDYALPFIFDTFDIVNNSFLGNFIDDGTKSIIETIRKVKRFSDPQYFTTWNIASELPYAVETGEGTGTFDLTLVHSVSTVNSVKLGGGSAGLTIQDPYKLMLITESDIEQAISDSVNFFKQNNFFRFSQTQLEKATDDLKNRLSDIRLQRGASRIIFQIQSNTILYKKIRAIIDEEGRELDFEFNGGSFGINLFSFSNDSIVVSPTALEGVNGLQGNEINLFKQIINNIYLLLGLAQTTQSQSKEYNLSTNYLRRKMDLHYRNKPIIQPMDEISIFMSSKTLTDSKVTQGLKYNFANNSLLNRINDTAGNIESTLNNIKNTFSGSGDGSSDLEQEKNAIAGPEFPLWLYGLLRNDFTRQSAGTCVFSGLCTEAPHSYNSNGTYTLSVNCADKSAYFKMGQFNINPSVEVYNSSLYDPLTPFKTNFDEASGFLQGSIPPLLEANKRLLNSRSIRAKLGRFRGSGIDERVFGLPDIENINSGQGTDANRKFARRFRNKFTAPDGFVYRWKEGIGSLTMYGEPHSPFDLTLGSFKAETSPNITKNPFAGQDIMNVISLLVTGQPYNFNNFVKGAVDFSKLSRNDLTNESLSSSFFKGLIDDLTKQNTVWGNFIPFKKLIINEKGYDFLASGQFDLIVKNERLNDLLRRRSLAFDRLSEIVPTANNPQSYKTGLGGDIQLADEADISSLSVLTTELKELDSLIESEVSAFNEFIMNKNLQSDEGTLGIFGNDISFDSSITGISGEINETQRRQERRDFRNKINLLTMRRIWKVRGNEDPNLFIVDDSYDKNYDIQAFERSLTSNLELFNSTYTDVFSQIEIISKLIGLEIFADSQGHIQARPPQYNRIPSSVFRNLLQKKVDFGIQIFPSYLEKLFFSSIQGLADELEIIEDQIRLRAAALGRTSEGQVVTMLRTASSSPGTGLFLFLTERSTGKLNQDIRRLLDQNNPDLQESLSSGALNNLSNLIKGPLNATVNFNVAAQANIINDKQSFQGNLSNINNEIQKIASRLEARTRQPQPSNLQSLLSNDRVVSITGRSQLDILRITNEISQYVAERQRIIKRLANSLRNLQEGLVLNSESGVAENNVLFSNINQSSLIPEIIEHMIEDENIDDLGFGSGKRYIIEDSQIKSFKLIEKSPEYNSVQVDGKLEGGLVDLPSGFNLTSGGNAIGTNFSVDYDMWRMYGFRPSQPVPAPFFTNPNTQCAPYAVFLLNLARKNIFQGECTIVGNEYIQAGEVYYIEDYDLLFYAEEIRHNFTYNGTFDTSLVLKYGRNPGEYIPTHLDIIGKGLYSNKNQAELVRQVRHGHVDNQNHVNTLIYDTSVPIINNADGLKSLVKGNYAEQNKNSLSNLLLITSGLLNTSNFGKVLTIQLRIYKNSDSEVSLQENVNLQRVAQGVREWVINPTSFSLDGKDLLPTSENPPKIDPDKIKLEIVDLNPNKEKEVRSPSSLAWSSARAIASTSNISSSLSPPITAQETKVGQLGGESDIGSQQDVANMTLLDRERRALVNSIIDVWVVFEDAENFLQTSKQQTLNNQAAQLEQEAIKNANG